MAAALGVFSTPLQKYYYKLQVRQAAQILAADLRQLQQRSLFQADSNELSLRVSSNNTSAYSVYKAMRLERTINFSSVSCGDVYFKQMLKKVSFSNAGNPTVSGAYVLRHKQLTDFSCRLSLQPVTGRVTIYEEK